MWISLFSSPLAYSLAFILRARPLSNSRVADPLASDWPFWCLCVLLFCYVHSLCSLPETVSLESLSFLLAARPCG